MVCVRLMTLFERDNKLSAAFGDVFDFFFKSKSVNDVLGVVFSAVDVLADISRFVITKFTSLLKQSANFASIKFKHSFSLLNILKELFTSRKTSLPTSCRSGFVVDAVVVPVGDCFAAALDVCDDIDKFKSLVLIAAGGLFILLWLFEIIFCCCCCFYCFCAQIKTRDFNFC